MMRGQSKSNDFDSSKTHSIGVNLPTGVTEIEINLPGGVKRTFMKEETTGVDSDRENNHVSLSSLSPENDYWYGEDSDDGSSFDFVLDTNGNIHGTIVDLKTDMISQLRVDAEGSPFVMTTPSSEFPDEEDADDIDENDHVAEDNIMVHSSDVDSEQLNDQQEYPNNRDLMMVTTSNQIQASINDYDRSNNAPSQISSQFQSHQERSLAFDDSGKNLDVLVVWSRTAECLESRLPRNCQPTTRTEANMRAMIKLAVAETNLAYRSSGVNTEIVLVHAYRHPSYNDSGKSSSTMLSHLRETSDGNMDDVHALRARYGADIVAMIADLPGGCGIGNIGPRKDLMFSVTDYSCATGYYSFAHEIGHNLGLNHDRGTKNQCSSNNYNFGYRDPNASFRSIMAYSCKAGQCDRNRGGGCARIQRFSSPNIRYHGKVVGIAGKADSARHINNVKALVAKYFPHKGNVPAPTPTPPSPSPP